MITVASGKSRNINWMEYGFQMDIPEDALRSSDTSVIAIRAVVTGNFKFPEGTEPVSAVYKISTSAEFVKPVTLKIQHCVALKREEDCRCLSFAIAHVQPDQLHLPCIFEMLEGGSFSPHSQYGTISCSSFCKVTIVKELNIHEQSSVVKESSSVAMDEDAKRRKRSHPDLLEEDSSDPGSSNRPKRKARGEGATPQLTDACSDETVSSQDAVVPQNVYTMMRFHKSTANYEYEFDFATMKRLEANISLTRQCWAGAQEDPSMTFQFIDGQKKVILGLEQDQTVEGWNISPANYPCIMQRNDIDAFGIEQAAGGPPYCRALVTATDDSQRDLRHMVTIGGVTSDVKSVLIHCTQDQPPRTNQQKSTSQYSKIQESPAWACPTEPTRSQISERVLDNNDLLDILNLLHDLTNGQYTMLGVQLGLHLPTLTQIEQASNAGGYGIHVFQAWLEQKDQVAEKGGPTWSRLIVALKAPSVNLKDHVKRIKDWLLKQ